MNEVLGFIGLNNEYIQGIFVCKSFQSNGIGKNYLKVYRLNNYNKWSYEYNCIGEYFEKISFNIYIYYGMFSFI